MGASNLVPSKSVLEDIAPVQRSFASPGMAIRLAIKLAINLMEGTKLLGSPTCSFLGVQWLAVISGIIVGIGIAQEFVSEVGWKLWWLMRTGWLKSRLFFKECWYSPGVRKIACEFCAEVAVLCAVFPILDALLANSGIRGDTKVTQHPIPIVAVMGWTALVVIPFLFAAVILAKRGEGD